MCVRDRGAGARPRRAETRRLCDRRGGAIALLIGQEHWFNGGSCVARRSVILRRRNCAQGAPAARGARRGGLAVGSADTVNEIDSPVRSTDVVAGLDLTVGSVEAVSGFDSRSARPARSAGPADGRGRRASISGAGAATASGALAAEGLTPVAGSLSPFADPSPAGNAAPVV